MKFVAHRINTKAELIKLPQHFGVELDLRPYKDRLVLQHDPFKDGESFEDYLKHYQHGTMILNVKSEGIEYKVLELLKLYKIQDYFFLDSSFPMINNLTKINEKKMALRFSEYEGLDTLELMKGKVEWVWVDCFNKLPINYDNYKKLKNWGYKLCLVSPELLKREEDISSYKNFIEKEKINFDAICTKSYLVERWQ